MSPHDFKAWRLRMKITQATAAEMLGTNRRTITRRENGNIKISRETELACAMLEFVTTRDVVRAQQLPLVPRPPSTRGFDWRGVVRGNASLTPSDGRSPERAPILRPFNAQTK